MIPLSQFKPITTNGNVHSHSDCKATNYSDGSIAENYIFDTLKNASDISVTSNELKNAIKDWPSEYHLSSVRANLLRPLDFSHYRNVLEIGCGCGPITRSLGERGLEVHAIEGSRRRSQIAGERCRDLKNVSVYNANYNDIALEPDHYDIITLIGVLEYAALFYEGKTTTDAAVAIIDSLKKALSPQGILIVAIENKLGYKYLTGCREDHTNMEYEGILGYPRSTGYETYSRHGLRSMLVGSGFSDVEFCYPFPDYKVPVTHISDGFLRSAESAPLLETSFSRDYSQERHYRIAEPLFCRTLGKAQLLPEFSNSFIAIAKNNERNHFNYDFVHYSSPNRHKQFAVETSKEINSPVVKRNAHAIEDQPLFIFCPHDEPFRQGQNFSSLLLEKALNKDLDAFHHLIAQYLTFLEANKPDSSNDQRLDMTFWNLAVDSKGGFHAFDLEWQLKTTPGIDVEAFLLFRSLLYWLASGIAPFFNHLHLEYDLGSFRDFIAFVFSGQDRLLAAEDLSAFIALEAQFQCTVAHSNTQKTSVFKQTIEATLKQGFPENDHVLKQNLFLVQKKLIAQNENSFKQHHESKRQFDELESYRIDLEKNFFILKDQKLNLEKTQNELELTIQGLQREVIQLTANAKVAEGKNAALENKNAQLESKNIEIANRLNQAEASHNTLVNDHETILNSRRWRFTSTLIRIVKDGKIKETKEQS